MHSAFVVDPKNDMDWYPLGLSTLTEHSKDPLNHASFTQTQSILSLVSNMYTLALQ